MPSLRNGNRCGKANKPVSNTIPLIDISPLRENDDRGLKAIATEIEAACTDTGFFTIIGHGGDLRLLQQTRQAAAEFFAAPDPVKRAVIRPPEKITRGWNPAGDRALSNTLDKETPPDLQEAWGMGPPRSGDTPYYTTGAGKTFFAPNKWPELAGYKKTITQYYDAMTRLADDVMRGFALALGIDHEFFIDKTNRQCSNVRFIRYPAQKGEPLKGQLRAGEHTDYGTFTFVKGDNVAGGLQISDGKGSWHNVETPENGFVCNIGDTMQLWTGGRFQSTLHRVANPPHNAASQDRISLVYFHQPNHDAILGGIGDAEGNGTGPTFAQHYFSKIMKANTTDTGSSTVTVEELVSGGTQ